MLLLGFVLRTGTVDVVTFSYALSMIPDWRAAIRNAFRMLKVVGVGFCCLLLGLEYAFLF